MILLNFYIPGQNFRFWILSRYWRIEAYLI